MSTAHPNLLVIGASGSVARAFLRRLGGQRCHFGNLILLDKNRRALRDPHLDHQRLAYRFLQRRLALPRDQGWYTGLLRRHRIQIVLDVSTHPTLPALASTDAAGVSYLNTSLNDEELEVGELVQRLHPNRLEPRHAPHILCAGMNPGVVNLLVRHGVEQFGLPRQIIHFEYDSSTPVDGWRPLVTWSKHEFLMETTWNRTGYFDGQAVRPSPANGIEHRLPLRRWLAPIAAADHCPEGFLVLHEENLTVGQVLGVPSRFIYALHPQTMKHLVERHRLQGTLHEHDLELGDNITRRLDGTDLIGVCLDYPRRRVYYVNRMPNSVVIGTNATCAQVAVGIFAALFTLLYDRLEPRVYFSGDLHDTLYKRFAFANLRIEQFVCARRNGRWVVRDHVPELRVRMPRDAAPVVL
jgi:hypothetical protein